MSKQDKQYLDVNLSNKVERKDILFDLKFMMSEYYVATFKAEGDILKVTFINGQSFIIKAEACV